MRDFFRGLAGFLIREGAGERRLIRIWCRLTTGRHLADVRVGPSTFRCRCALSDDGKWLAYTLDSDHARVVRMR